MTASSTSQFDDRWRSQGTRHGSRLSHPTKRRLGGALSHPTKRRLGGARIIKGRPFRSRLWLLCEAVNQTSRKEHPMDSIKYIGLDVHRDTISVAVLNADGKLEGQSVIATHAATIVDFFHGLRGSLHVTLEEGTHSAWLYDLLARRVAKLVVCNPRKNALLKAGSKSDTID